MSVVVTFENYRPTPRYDHLAWTEVRIEESSSSTGPWTLIDTQTLTPVDADPSVPESRSFTTENGTAADQWYRLVFADATGDVLGPTYAVQNIASRTPYASVEELAALLRVRVADRADALQRVLESAAFEIDAELGRAEPFSPPPALVVEVNLERAVEHWQQQQSPFGLIGLGTDITPAFSARDSWDRHAHKLAPLKETWGFA